MSCLLELDYVMHSKSHCAQRTHTQFKPTKAIWQTLKWELKSTFSYALHCSSLENPHLNDNDGSNIPILLHFRLSRIHSDIDSSSMASASMEFWDMLLHDVGIPSMFEPIREFYNLGRKCPKSSSNLVRYLYVLLTFFGFWRLTKISSYSNYYGRISWPPGGLVMHQQTIILYRQCSHCQCFSSRGTNPPCEIWWTQLTLV